MFTFAGHIIVRGRKRPIAGELVLGGRTKLGQVLRPAEAAAPGVRSLIDGIGHLPVVGGFAGPVADRVGKAAQTGQEHYGIDGPPAEVASDGETAEVQLSAPNQRQEAYGTVDLPCGAGRLTVTGFPVPSRILLTLQPCRGR